MSAGTVAIASAGMRCRRSVHGGVAATADRLEPRDDPLPKHPLRPVASRQRHGDRQRRDEGEGADTRGRGIDAHAPPERGGACGAVRIDARGHVDGRRVGRGCGAEIADELDVRGIADHQHELVALLRGAGRVEGVARGEHLEQRCRAIREDDPADRRAVVEPEAVRLEGRDEPADPDPRADVRGEVPQVDVGRHRGRAR